MFLTHYYHKLAWEKDIICFFQDTPLWYYNKYPIYFTATFRVKASIWNKNIICCVPGKTFCIGNEEQWCYTATPTIPPFGHIWCIYQEWYQEGLVFFKRKNNNSNNDTLYVWIHLHIFQALYIQAQFSAA